MGVQLDPSPEQTGYDAVGFAIEGRFPYTRSYTSLSNQKDALFKADPIDALTDFLRKKSALFPIEEQCISLSLFLLL